MTLEHELVTPAIQVFHAERHPKPKIASGKSFVLKRRASNTRRARLTPESWLRVAARTEEIRRRKERLRKAEARQKQRQARANELAAFRSMHLSRMKLLIAMAARTRLEVLRAATSGKANHPGLRRLKGQEKDLVRYWIRAQTTHAYHGGKASLRQLAHNLRMSIGAIQRREKMMASLEQSIWQEIAEKEALPSPVLYRSLSHS